MRKTVLKTCRKSKFLGKKIWRNTRAKRYKVYLGKPLFWHYYLQLSTKPCLRFLLICFAREIKGFYQSSRGNKVDFRDIMSVSPNTLAKNWNFKKLRLWFCRWKNMITTTLISLSHWKTLVHFCLRKKRPEKAFLTLIVNYRKIVQKNKWCHPKQ